MIPAHGRPRRRPMALLALCAEARLVAVVLAPHPVAVEAGRRRALDTDPSMWHDSHGDGLVLAVEAEAVALWNDAVRRVELRGRVRRREQQHAAPLRRARPVMSRPVPHGLWHLAQSGPRAPRCTSRWHVTHDASTLNRTAVPRRRGIGRRSACDRPRMSPEGAARRRTTTWRCSVPVGGELEGRRLVARLASIAELTQMHVGVAGADTPSPRPSAARPHACLPGRWPSQPCDRRTQVTVACRPVNGNAVFVSCAKPETANFGVWTEWQAHTPPHLAEMHVGVTRRARRRCTS